MIVELNIGLDAPRYRDNTMLRWERFAMACGWVLDHFKGPQMHVVPAGWYRAHTLVVRGEERDMLTTEDIRCLSDAINQDCVAVRMGFNALIGLHADKYQPFDITKFITMEQAMHNVPAQHQTDPAKAAGQVVNPIPPSMLYKPAHGGYPGNVPTSPATK